MSMVPKILLVEDQEIDIKLVQIALKKCSKPIDLSVVRDGVDAWTILQEKNDFDLILLDLNMPVMNGKDFLRQLKNDPKNRATVVLMFTSSDNESDIKLCYELGANGYICKPESPTNMANTINGILHFWFDLAKHPDRNFSHL